MGRLPTVKPKDVIRALKRAGDFIHHRVGSHHQLKHPLRPGKVTIAVHNKDMRKRILKRVIDQTGFSVDEFIALLRK